MRAAKKRPLEELRQMEWVRPYELLRLYPIGRAIVYNIFNEMKKEGRYQESFKKISRTCAFVKLADFDEFLLLKNEMRLAAFKE